MADDTEKLSYRREGNDTLIEIRLHNTRQLFHTLDPAPFQEKDLDENAASYLVEACGEAGNRPLRLVIHLPMSETQNESARTIPQAVNNYFAYRAQQLRKDLVKLLRYGAISLVIGLLFLMACLALRRVLIAHPIMIDQAIVDEGLLILGWVAMWRPIEVLLYDWWPLARKRALLNRLATISVEVRGIPSP